MTRGNWWRYVTVWWTVLALAAVARAERPMAPRLLPEGTVAYFRIENLPALREKFQQTATGKMAQDEQLKPLLGSLWQSAVQAFTQIEEKIGASLYDLLAIPQGEVCLAIVLPPEGRPELIGWMDCGDREATMQKLVAQGEQQLAARGSLRSTERIGEIELIQHEIPEERRSRLVHCFVDRALVVSSHPVLMREVLNLWTGNQAAETATLADNRQFTAILNRCSNPSGPPPQVTWYVNPIAIAERRGQESLSGKTTLWVVESLGLDGLQGIGGSLAFAVDDLDGIFHVHALLDSPRAGVLEALAIQPGDVTPEPWVPNDVAAYSTWNWEVPRTYREVVRVFELFRGGKGSWQAQVLEPTKERTGVDLEAEFLDLLSGRFTILAWMEKPARINSQTRLFGMQVRDPVAMERVLGRLADRFPERLRRQTYGGITYFRTETPRPRRETNPEIVRQPEPCLALLDDYLLVTDSVPLLQHVILAKSDSTQALANELDFKIIASRIQRQTGELRAAMVGFDRPEEGFRQMYDLAISAPLRAEMKRRSEQNPLFQALDAALADHPLPPFAVLARYLAPGGAWLTTEETGFHYVAFSLKRD